MQGARLPLQRHVRAVHCVAVGSIMSRFEILALLQFGVHAVPHSFNLALLVAVSAHSAHGYCARPSVTTQALRARSHSKSKPRLQEMTAQRRTMQGHQNVTFFSIRSFCFSMTCAPCHFYLFIIPR